MCKNGGTAVIPKNIAQKLRELGEICEKYPNAIPVDVVAEFNGTHPESLRNSLKEGSCPFGYAWNRGSRSGFCIPTLRFYLWVTDGKGLPDE